MIRRLTRAGCMGSDASFAPHQGPYFLGTLGKSLSLSVLVLPYLWSQSRSPWPAGMPGTWKVVVSPGFWCSIGNSGDSDSHDHVLAALQLCLWAFKQINLHWLHLFLRVGVCKWVSTCHCVYPLSHLTGPIFVWFSVRALCSPGQHWTYYVLSIILNSWSSCFCVSSARVTGASHLAFYAPLVMKPSGQALWAPSLSPPWLWVFLWSLLALGNIAITLHTSDEETGSDRLSKFVQVYPLVWA